MRKPLRKLPVAALRWLLNDGQLKDTDKVELNESPLFKGNPLNVAFVNNVQFAVEDPGAFPIVTTSPALIVDKAVEPFVALVTVSAVVPVPAVTSITSVSD